MNCKLLIKNSELKGNVGQVYKILQEKSINDIAEINVKDIQIISKKLDISIKRVRECIKQLQSINFILRKNNNKYSSLIKSENYRKARHLKSTYNLDFNEYYKLLENQEYKCAICLEEEKNCTKGVLYVDHCHDTGKIRGLLCHKCNLAIGLFKNDTNIIQSSLDYLRKTK